MYSKYEKKPSFVTTGESVGYVLECNNYKEEFDQGEQLSFQLILYRRDSAMTLRGIKGKVWFEGADLDTMKLLLVGELLHIGKNSSFGFGEYQVMW